MSELRKAVEKLTSGEVAKADAPKEFRSDMEAMAYVDRCYKDMAIAAEGLADAMSDLKEGVMDEQDWSELRESCYMAEDDVTQIAVEAIRLASMLRKMRRDNTLRRAEEAVEFEFKCPSFLMDVEEAHLPNAFKDEIAKEIKIRIREEDEDAE